MDAYIQDNTISIQFRNLCKIKVSMFNIRNSVAGVIAYIKEFEVIENCTHIIGNPMILLTTRNNQCIDGNSFCVVQCRECKTVITHSGYSMKGLTFSYMIQCKVDNEMMVRCDCGNGLGTKMNYYVLAVENIIVTKFPKQILQNQTEFMNGLNGIHDSVKNLRMSNEAIINNFEERIEKNKKSIADINKVIGRIYKKTNDLVNGAG